MKAFEQAGFSGTRRRLLGGSAALAALSVVPTVWAAAAAPAVSTRPAVWLGRFDDGHDRWRPVAAACKRPSGDRALRIVVRGPCALSGSPDEDLALEAVYRSFPDRPFHLGSGLRPPARGGTVLHVDPRALTALQVRQGTRTVRCELTNLFSPAMSPGRYAVLIDTDGNRRDPDWRRLETSINGFPVHAGSQRPMAAVILDIRAA